MSNLQRVRFGLSVVASLALCAGGALAAGGSQFGASAPAVSRDGGKKDKQVVKVEGILTAAAIAVDGSGTVTIHTKKGNVIVTVDATTKFEQNEMNITAADVVNAIGSFAEATISTATGVAQKVEIGS